MKNSNRQKLSLKNVSFNEVSQVIKSEFGLFTAENITITTSKVIFLMEFHFLKLNLDSVRITLLMKKHQENLKNLHHSPLIKLCKCEYFQLNKCVFKNGFGDYGGAI